MSLCEAVEETLNGSGAGAGLRPALGLVREEFGFDSVGVAAFDQGGRFRVVANDGDGLVLVGTQLPIHLSTSLVCASEGEVWCSNGLDSDSGFSRAVDRLVAAAGFRSACSIPLMIGSRSCGSLNFVSRSASNEWEAIVEELGDVTASVTLALLSSQRADSGHILICHEDELLREGLARVLEQSLDEDVQICGARDEALAHADENAERIAMVICDALFDEGRAHGFLRDLRLLGVAAPMLVLDSHDAALGHHVARLSGATGYVRRSEGCAAVVAAVREIKSGQRVGPYEEGSEQHLTVRECTLLLLLERGLRFKQIAVEMGICESTVRGYATKVFTKLDVHSRGEAVYEARRRGILDLLHAGARTAPVSATDQI